MNKLESENKFYPAVIWNIKNGIVFMDLMESKTSDVISFLKVVNFTNSFLNIHLFFINFTAKLYSLQYPMSKFEFNQ